MRKSASAILFGMMIGFVGCGGSNQSSIPPNKTAIKVEGTPSRFANLKQEWEDIKKAEANWPESVRKAEVGVTTTIVGPGASWPCAKSKSAAVQMVRLYKISLDDQEGARGEDAFRRFSDLMVASRTSIMLAPRDRVKILQKEENFRQISLVEKHKGAFSGGQKVTAESCWTSADAVVRRD